MKVLIVLAFVASLTAALRPAKLETRQGRAREHRKTSRPQVWLGKVAEMHVPNRPVNAPPEYKTGVAHPSRKLSNAVLKTLPAALVDADFRRRGVSPSPETVKFRRQSGASDFYECHNSVRHLGQPQTLSPPLFLLPHPP